MSKHCEQVNREFQALADPTRRGVLERLNAGPIARSELARPYPMALPYFSQHLGVLERCGLVRSSKAGRVRTYSLSPRTLGTAAQWLGRQRALGSARLDQLDEVLQDHKEQTR